MDLEATGTIHQPNQRYGQVHVLALSFSGLQIIITKHTKQSSDLCFQCVSMQLCFGHHLIADLTDLRCKKNLGSKPPVAGLCKPAFHCTARQQDFPGRTDWA